MTNPIRLQLSRAKGFNLQAASRALNGLPAVKVDRTTRWGNPFIVNTHVRAGSKSGAAFTCVPTIEDAVECFREWLALPENEVHLDAAIRAMRGKNLACWCSRDALCHADVLLEIANR